MAGDWIKMRIDLLDDPAVIRIALLCGIDEFSVLGRLHHLWGWANRQSCDGLCPGITAAWVDTKVRLKNFANALVSVGWLHIDDHGVQIVNFDRHNGESAKTRAMGAERQRTKRARDAARILQVPASTPNLQAAVRTTRRMDRLHAPSKWKDSFDGVKARGAELGLPYPDGAFSRCWTDDEKNRHDRAYRLKVEAADKAAGDVGQSLKRVGPSA